MFSLKGRQDGFRLLLPQEFICDEINDKYAKILQNQKSFFTKPIDFLNETIQSVQVLGFSDGTVNQPQPGIGHPLIDPNRVKQNKFLHTATDFTYRSEVNPLQLIDKTLNITFRHTLGFLNYFLLFENFWYLYSRDKQYEDISFTFNIDIINQNGQVYSKIVLYDPIIHGIDMLDLNYTKPVADSQTFTVIFKYSNIDYQFISTNDLLIQ